MIAADGVSGFKLVTGLTPANTEKVRLEEKQRAVRRQREAEQELATQEGREYTGQSWTLIYTDI